MPCCASLLNKYFDTADCTIFPICCPQPPHSDCSWMDIPEITYNLPCSRSLRKLGDAALIWQYALIALLSKLLTLAGQFAQANGDEEVVGQVRGEGGNGKENSLTLQPEEYLRFNGRSKG